MVFYNFWSLRSWGKLTTLEMRQSIAKNSKRNAKKREKACKKIDFNRNGHTKHYAIYQRVGGIDTGFAYLPYMRIGVKTVVTNHDLSFVRNMGGHPGDKT